MLRLASGQPQPARVELGGGAWVEVRPATSIESESALAEVTRAVAAVRLGEEVLALAGYDAPALVEDEGLRAGLADFLHGVELAVRCVTAWGGIGDDDGRPIPEPTREAVTALMRDPGHARKVRNACLAGIHRVVAEGNASAASPTGAGEAARPIAADAATPARPAPTDDADGTAGSAPSASTPRTPPKAHSRST